MVGWLERDKGVSRIAIALCRAVSYRVVWVGGWGYIAYWGREKPALRSLPNPHLAHLAYLAYCSEPT
ncbi:hypothetical protein I7I50_09079 [Histoplasma capsulatum G186AR]|nr:hypothetical protein I7I52_06598 [Histoplasma capsulatum]QSS74059.1 hypothetical protein I7I50_09079 [Histoplasma capsulatum G186AR]